MKQEALQIQFSRIKSIATKSFDDQMSRIERLAEMKEEGILTDEEFQQQKQRILNG